MRKGPAGRRDLSILPLHFAYVPGAETQRTVQIPCELFRKRGIGCCVNGPQAQRPPPPAAQVLGCLAEYERMQISHSFALLKQVRWWEEPAAWNLE